MSTDTMVFVPAIMSAGLIFSIVTVARDALRWTGGRARERRATSEAHAVMAEVTGQDRPPPSSTGVLPRRNYLVAALALVAGAAYVAVGSTANFLKDGGYVSDIAWLLALSLGLAALLGFLGGVSLIVFWRWPHPPAWTLGSLRAAPLTVRPGVAQTGPSWELSAALGAVTLTAGIVALMVSTQRGIAFELDQPILDWLIEIDWIDRLAPIDPFGSTALSIGIIVLIGLSGFRCRVMALAYPLAFMISWGLTELLQGWIARPRPIGIGALESFPSGHMVQATLMAGLLPTALGVLFLDRRIVVLSRVVLASAVIATGLRRVHQLAHWPLDVVGGVLVGSIAVIFAHWMLAHRSWHHYCQRCPHSADLDEAAWDRGLLKLDERLAARLGRLGAFLAIGASAGLAVGTVTIGLPTDPEGAGLGSAIVDPIQIGFATLMAIAGLMALRFKAVAAFLMAIAATGLGLAASVQYAPSITFALAAALLVPAVLTWAAWQPRATIGSIATLAVVTATALGATTLGSREIYRHYFGPTHPASTASPLESDAEWLWLGDVAETSATVVGGGLDHDGLYTLLYWPASGGDHGLAATDGGQIMRRADDHGLARFELEGLEPDTEYAYAVRETSDGADLDDPEAAPDASFSTHARGPQDLVVLVGSCARVESNGAVFDSMVNERADLYLAVGDLHYANLSTTDPSKHVDAYGRSLSEPGQAALFSSVPSAYVWDDHDYGPNDAGASSPSRLAVSEAYRAAVPHAGVDPDLDAPIAQAFTVGRVRFVLADTRSQRTDDTMLGTEQLDWLIDELVSASRTHAVVVWANPTPWIADEGSGADNWSAHPTERQMIADALVEADVDNLVMVSGDAHMLAIDDGTNSGYATDGSAGFPILHAAALDRPGSVKGGPYSEGTFPGGGQYGRLLIRDDGGELIDIELSGHDWEGNEVVRWSFTVDADSVAD